VIDSHFRVICSDIKSSIVAPSPANLKTYYTQRHLDGLVYDKRLWPGVFSLSIGSTVRELSVLEFGGVPKFNSSRQTVEIRVAVYHSTTTSRLRASSSLSAAISMIARRIIIW
jgi:hypothetical protein